MEVNKEVGVEVEEGEREGPSVVQTLVDTVPDGDFRDEVAGCGLYESAVSVRTHRSHRP